MLQRREFLVRASAAFGAATLATAGRAHAERIAADGARDAEDWESVRAEFALEPGYAQFAGFFLASHPRPVREAIEKHRRGLDANPIGYIHDNRLRLELGVVAAAAAYLRVNPGELALTDSTTMGLGLVYTGMMLRPEDEVVTSDHDHPSTVTSLAFASKRGGAKVVRAPLYKTSSAATAAEMVESVVSVVTPRTRVVALTWVHSKSGLRIPVRAIADALKPLNEGRGPEEKILLCIDGVHGIGAVPGEIPDLGCDVFIAGTHKWVFGPRGTGLVWATEAAWERIAPTIPPFGPKTPAGPLNTPGGFHSFEHRWAVGEAFLFHERIGKERVYGRVRELNRKIRVGLAAMPHVEMHTPMDDELSAGIVCFDVKGMKPGEVVDRLQEKRVIGSVSPYQPPCARLSGGLLNTDDEVAQALEAVKGMG